MGWFRRRKDDEPAEPAASSTPDVEEPAPFVAARDSGPSAGDWMAMPPMPRTVGPAPSRATSLQRLSDMMTTRRPLALTGTLGHRVSPLAPAGSVEGLATAVSRPHEVDGGGDLTLRMPPSAQAPHVDGDVPLVQREVSPTTSTTPSLPAITQAGLPQPPPARALREPVTLPGRDVGADNPPRPLAVVQRQAASPAAASTAASASTPAVEGEPAVDGSARDDAAPEGAGPEAAEDAPVGGTPLRPTSAPSSPQMETTGVDDQGVHTGDGTVVDLPLAATAPAAPSISMEDVMPPIQPRAIQRRAAEAAGASARPETAAGAPLPPLPDWARRAPASRDEAAAPSLPPGAPAAPAAAPSMPLQHPTVQREAAAPGAAPSAAPPLSPLSPSDDEGEAEHAPSGATTRSQTAGDATTAADPAPDAPLAGDAAPIAAMPGALEAGGLPDVAELVEEAPPVDLPLHASGSSAPAAAVDEPEGPPPNRWNAPSERMPSDRVPEPEPADDAPAVQRMADHGAAGSSAEPIVPLLGDRPLPLFGQPSPDTATVSGAGVPATAGPAGPGGALPLAPDAPSAGGPVLATPPAPPPASPPPTASSARAAATGPAQPASTPLAHRVQREAASGATGATAAAASAVRTAAATATPPPRALLSLPERPAASPGAGGPLTEPLPVTPPAGAPPVPAMDAPLALHALHTAPSPAATHAPVQTAPRTAPHLDTTSPALATPGAPSSAVAARSAMPLQAPVQRSTDASSPHAATAGAARGADAGQTIGDLAVASGLGVVQPDGSVLFTRQDPPPAGDAPVQRAIATAPAAAPGLSRSDIAASDAGGGGEGPAASDPDLDQLARKLLPRFRRLIATEVRTGRGRTGASPWNRH
jgi:hypothetical protein